MCLYVNNRGVVNNELATQFAFDSLPAKYLFLYIPSFSDLIPWSAMLGAVTHNSPSCTKVQGQSRQFFVCLTV